MLLIRIESCTTRANRRFSRFERVGSGIYLGRVITVELDLRNLEAKFELLGSRTAEEGWSCWISRSKEAKGECEVMGCEDW